MQPEDRLDALLASPRQPPVGAAAGDPQLAPLLDAARRVRALGAAQPDAHLAEALRARMLTRAAEVRLAQPTPLPTALPIAGDSRQPAWRLRTALGGSTRRSLVAAALLLVALGTGTLTAAAAAPPGSPLFGLRRAEETLRAAATGDSSARVQLHLQYARQWLADVRDAAKPGQGGDAYLSALQALRQEDAAAASALAAMPGGAARQALAAQLAHLRADESATLGTALATIGWPERIATTQTLGALGATVPRISSAQLDQRGESWHITITGSGFLPGAVLLVDGQAVTAETQVSPTQLTARLPRARDRATPHTLGVGNPDGTAAASALTLAGNSDDQHGQGTPGSDGNQPGANATTTPGGDQEDGTPTPGGDHGHGTPTPSAHP
ncbi:MAG TPA: IPT/TIG domain-containing protein [Ktedonobacterales bacterium]|nr:IPT/TIG domain-containing protein [Ktedonobacterales bacterium]